MRVPTGYADTFQVLMEHKEIGKKLCEPLEKMANFRKVVVHQYETIDPTIVVSILHEHLRDLGKYNFTHSIPRRPTKDHFIADERIFESPKEKELYSLLTQTKFFQNNKAKIKIVPQFNIGKYIAQEYQRYIPRYRVDFLVILSEGGKEKSLILEYDGLEYHTRDPQVVRSLEDFREEYLEYDLRRQLELESFGYRFLRINKFTLLPKKGIHQTPVEVLSDLLQQSFGISG